jgi:hypothetical protein
MTHRLVLIHGINNQGGSEKSLSEVWMEILCRAVDEPTAFRDVEVSAPFYGNVLHELEHATQPIDVVVQGFERLDEEGRRFVESGLEDIATSFGISSQRIDEDVTSMGLSVHNRRFIALVRLLESVSPLQGRLALRVLNQAYVYLNHDWVTDAVDDIVAPVLADNPSKVIVAHSLGTVITFKQLRELGKAGSPRRIPLLLTLGSPLAIKCVQQALRGVRRRPEGVSRWLNGFDPNDFVTLGRGLTEKTFGPGVENDGSLRNPLPDAHAITSYLAHPSVAQVIRDACYQ